MSDDELPSVTLVVWWINDETPVSLTIPINDIQELSRTHLKWLHYLGWCILGVDGYISANKAGDRIDELDNTLLSAQETYHYVTPNGTTLSSAVEANIVTKSRTASVISARRQYFSERIFERDGSTIFSHVTDMCVSAHILPHCRGDEMIQSLYNKRIGMTDEEPWGTVEIDAVQNGILMDPFLHGYFDNRKANVLVTPNHVLTHADILPEVQPDTNRRYTLQWFQREGHANIDGIYPHNADIPFGGNGSNPSPLLLHYVYGAAAMLRWGHSGIVEYADGVSKYRPPLPAQPPGEPSKKPRTAADRQNTLDKRNGARDAARRGESSHAGPSTGGGGETRRKLTSDEAMDIVFFLTAVGPAERQRLEALKEEEEWRNERIQSWVLSGSHDH